MTQILRPAISLMVLFTVLLGVGYPLAITGIAQLAFPSRANGSLIRDGEAVIGSTLIGQDFGAEIYFWPRPSATAETPYNAAASSGTNLGPTSETLRTLVSERIQALKAAGIVGTIPADGASFSGSGLDPHISPAYALLQVPRVAKARGLDLPRLNAIVERHIEDRFLGMLGEPRVNVLLLNLALDAEPRG